MDIETIGAIALNVAVYLSLAAAVVQWSRQRTPRPADAPGAFRLLELGLKRAFPDLPQGFTLREGLSRARLAGLDMSWEDIDRTVADYEAYRFGAEGAPSLPQPELMRLVRALWRRG
jgi:hypothetical protein